MRNYKRNFGFTMVEIMLVVGIIILLVALAIPNLLRVRLNADEASAVASLRAIGRACENYRAAQTPPTFPSALTVLSNSSPILSCTAEKIGQCQSNWVQYRSIGKTPDRRAYHAAFVHNNT